MKPLLTIADTRAVERAMFAETPSFSIMQRAGEAVAETALAMLEKLPNKTAPVIAIAGGGNNGGDAAIAADTLHRAGVNVRLLYTTPTDTLSGDAAKAHQQWKRGGGAALTLDNLQQQNNDLTLPDAALLIDGIFGIGLSRPPQGTAQQLISAINRHPAPVLAIDVASGLCADSGSVKGSAVAATKTITFFTGKPGLYTGDGTDHSGEINIVPLDAPPPAQPSGYLMHTAPPLQRLRRRRNSHKGSHSTLALIGGAAGMLGALVLAARAAATLGAGKTIACALERCPAVDWQRPDIIWRAAADTPLDADCFAAGMGIGTTAAAWTQIKQLLPLEKPLLLDADGLTLLAANRKQWRPRSAPTILTPHPGEAARLLQQTTTDINTNRPAAAAALAAEWQATIVLKGAGTLIHPPDHPFIICTAGNPGLARGGSGDILSGIIAALLTQTNDSTFAATAGTWLHAAAADLLAKQQGELGLDINAIPPTAAALARV